MKKSKIKWHSEVWKLADLTEWDKNPRILKEKGVSDLDKSIEKFGLAEPVVINTDGLIIGGHGRFKVIQAQGETECDCYVPSRTLKEKEVKELNIRLNANIAGEFNWEQLANEWEAEELVDWGLDLPLDFVTEVEAEEDDSMTIKLTYVEDEYFKVREQLQEYGGTPEAAIWKLLGNEATTN
jgi:site-specific DNA-methyltransferase (adenine-specific)